MVQIKVSAYTLLGFTRYRYAVTKNEKKNDSYLSWLSMQQI